MKFLVLLELPPSGELPRPQETLTLIERHIQPSLEALIRLEEEKRVIAGGPVAGKVAFVLVIEAASHAEAEHLLTSLPFWPLMKVDITPLVDFQDRLDYVHGRKEALKALLASKTTSVSYR